ncbi:MAG TPA: type IV pili methyl-accepting chemotaxis transducer N-terminal domain-containing protein [Azonexus sp.]|nr:type IV pili methyl-accepting chemotaxis transducer N-terminal domain-containing protein [Azonexus sp.]
MFIKYLPYAALGLLLSFSSHAEDSQAVNIAGQQRMLSQRIVKSYCQIGLNILPEVSRKQLEQAIQTFDENLLKLAPAASTPLTQASLDKLRSAWEPLRRNAQGEVKASTAETLDRQAEAVLQAAEQLTSELQDQSSPPIGRWVNTAGRQRMLSQRLTKAYMLRQWGLDSAGKRQEIESAVHEFSSALSSMQQRPDNSPTIRAQLGELGIQWEWLRTALASEGASNYRLIVAESSDVVLELAERVTILFTQEK